MNMNEEEYYKKKRMSNLANNMGSASTSASTNEQQRKNKSSQPPKRPYGNNVGKEGGNPEYKKNVIQLEQERIERERQELIMKRKRNSNYI